MKYFSKKLAARFGANFSNTASTNNAQRKEGEVTIEKVPTKQKSSNTVGQYVDYEEID